jgi:hypothetical protein
VGVVTSGWPTAERLSPRHWSGMRRRMSRLSAGVGRSRGDGSESEYAGEPCEGDEGAMGGNGKIGVEGVEPREAEG